MEDTQQQQTPSPISEDINKDNSSEAPIDKKSEDHPCKEYIEMAKRARADYENLKKETERWKMEFARFANQSLLEQLLPIIDGFGDAMSHIPEGEKTNDWVVGIIYIKKQFEDLLKHEGVELYGHVGERFDPHLHEAVSEVDGIEQETGTIVKVVRVGCRIGERVVRPGQVIVAK